MSAATAQIVVPPMGESVSEATVAKWLKKAGDSVRMDEPLVELETDKVTLEVNAQAAGVISEIKAPQGSTVAVGAVLGLIQEGAAGAAPSAAVPAATPVPTPAPAPAAAPNASAEPAVMPAARKQAEDRGVNIASLFGFGSGKGGRVTKEDVINAAEKPAAAPATSAPAQAPSPAARAPQPSGPRSNAAREERVKMSRLRQRIAERLKEAQNTAAMLTTFNEVDMTNILALRNQHKEQFE